MKVSKELYDELSQLRVAILNDAGQEVNNPRPLFANVSPRPQTITDQIRRLLRSELSKQAQEQGYESFEDADDFADDEVDDGPDSAYTVMADESPKARPKVQPKVEPAAVPPAVDLTKLSDADLEVELSRRKGVSLTVEKGVSKAV